MLYSANVNPDANTIIILGNSLPLILNGFITNINPTRHTTKPAIIPPVTFSLKTIDANAIPVNKHDADDAFSAATCIGCGACVASCKNSSAMLFVGAKVSQFALLPQGQVEATDRVMNMVKQMDEEGFGNCTNTGACEAECPKGIKLSNIARMNREYFTAKFFREEDVHTHS